MKRQKNKKKIMNYRQAKIFLKNNYPEINTVKNWFQFAEMDNFPEHLPKNPLEEYSETGEWKSWEDFLSYNRKNDYVGAVSYEEAMDLVHRMGINSLEQYRRFINEFNIKNLPSRPDFFYKEFDYKLFFGEEQSFTTEEIIDFVTKEGIRFNHRNNWEYYFLFCAPPEITKAYSEIESFPFEKLPKNEQ